MYTDVDVYSGSTIVLLYGGIGNRVVRAVSRYDVPFRAVVSMSYPKDMYVKVCGTREWASIRVLGYMYIIYIREYIYQKHVLVIGLFS